MEVVQDSEDEQTKSKKTVVEDAEKPDGDEAADKSAAENDEGDEEEYEIEAILEAKHGTFPGGRMGYLVKWKGYDDNHNSWVDQEDAGNATILIDEFWKKQNKEKKAKPKSKVRSRKSVARDESPDSGEPPSSNKRKKTSASGRKSKSSQPEPEEDGDDDDEKPKVKKAKKAPRAKDPSEDMMGVLEDDDAESQYRPMQKYKDKKSWENLVARVDTIEKVEGTLKVFFTLYV